VFKAFREKGENPMVHGRMIRMLALGAALSGLAGAARAQTLLSLGATGQVRVVPDEMVASLQVQASATRAADAQDTVNRAMKKALDLAHAVQGVVATTNGYNVFKNTPDNAATPPQFQASQTLQLVIPAPEGNPPDRFTALLGQLQQNGLLLNTLDGDLSRDGQLSAQQDAIGDAIGQIQAQAAMIAGRLKENISEIKTLNVNVDMPGPMPRMMMMAAAAPQAAPDKVTVQVNVSATMVLTAGK
jgi:uncharacterized protein YggE